MRIAALALAASTLVTPAFAQNKPATGIPDEVPAPMVRAIQEMLSPETLSEIRSRATGGNTVEGVLETILLNNLQVLDARGLGAHIIAIDFTRQVLVADIANQGPKVYHFDRRTLKVTQ